MTTNKDLKIALQSQIALIEKHYDDNLVTIYHLTDQAEWYRSMNKDLMEKIRNLSKQIDEL